jgi:hypothetical protein
VTLSVYFDEDFASSAHARALARAGLDAVRPHDVGMLGRADDEQLAFASSAGRILISYNRKDFQRIHAEWMAAAREHSGILLVFKDSDYSPGELLRRLRLIAATFASSSLQNQLLYLSNFRDPT